MRKVQVKQKRAGNAAAVSAAHAADAARFAIGIHRLAEDMSTKSKLLLVQQAEFNAILAAFKSGSANSEPVLFAVSSSSSDQDVVHRVVHASTGNFESSESDQTKQFDRLRQMRSTVPATNGLSTPLVGFGGVSNESCPLSKIQQTGTPAGVSPQFDTGPTVSATVPGSVLDRITSAPSFGTFCKKLFHHNAYIWLEDVLSCFGAQQYEWKK
jgi:hypothetical protein